VLAVDEGCPVVHGVFSDMRVDVVVGHYGEVEHVIVDVEFGVFRVQGLILSFSQLVEL